MLGELIRIVDSNNEEDGIFYYEPFSGTFRRITEDDIKEAIIEGRFPYPDPYGDNLNLIDQYFELLKD